MVTAQLIQVAVFLAAAAIAAPHVVPLAEQKLEEVAISDMKNLEGVSLDAAIEAAEITQAAVKVIVLPVASLVAFLGSGALGIVVLALQGAHNALSFFHLSTDVVDSMETIVQSWQAGLTHFDTADAYGGGRSELSIGHWIASRGVRPRLTTKTFNPMEAGADHGLEPDRVARQLRSSLDRLGADQVELYLAHDYDPDVPLAPPSKPPLVLKVGSQTLSFIYVAPGKFLMANTASRTAARSVGTLPAAQTSSIALTTTLAAS